MLSIYIHNVNIREYFSIVQQKFLKNSTNDQWKENVLDTDQLNDYYQNEGIVSNLLLARSFSLEKRFVDE